MQNVRVNDCKLPGSEAAKQLQTIKIYIAMLHSYEVPPLKCHVQFATNMCITTLQEL